jgi:hypothetical protein
VPPALKPILRQLQRLAVRFDRIVQELLLRISATHFERVDRNLGVQAQPNSFEVCVAGLRLFLRGCDGAAYPPPQIDFIREVNGQRKVSGTVIYEG